MSNEPKLRVCYVRTTRALHMEIMRLANAEKRSLNDWITEAINEKLVRSNKEPAQDEHARDD